MPCTESMRQRAMQIKEEAARERALKEAEERRQKAIDQLAQLYLDGEISISVNPFTGKATIKGFATTEAASWGMCQPCAASALFSKYPSLKAEATAGVTTVAKLTKAGK